ncbi:MAG: hypothetical protein DRI57_22180 [Deltaproteobacteria bacterium]|nr:MAG: hypothetical protein DRI57_22180 [Deltaproteobacteria bacterium]
MMMIYINQRINNTENVGYREFGFGKEVTLDTCSYLIEIPKYEFINLMNTTYSDCIDELKKDDEITGEFDPPFPGATEYPSLEVFIEDHKEAFVEFFKIYFETDFLSLLFSNKNDPVYVINSVDNIEITDASVIVSGKAYKKDDIRLPKITPFISQKADFVPEMVASRG